MTKTQTKITTKQISYIHALLHKYNLLEDKKQYAMEFSNGRTESIAGLNIEEAKQVIASLTQQELAPDPRVKMQRYILSMCHELAWKKEDGKVDINKLDNWCIHSSYLKKKFNEYEYDELPKLVTQFETMYKSYLHKL